MDHLRGGIPAAIGMRTTGPVPGHHEIYELAIVLLDPNTFEIDNEKMPFQVLMKPNYPENSVGLSRPTLDRLHRHGLLQDASFDLFDTWFSTLGMAYKKEWPHQSRIIPICLDWVSIYNMLISWSGYSPDHHPNIDLYFDPAEYRDLSCFARFILDVQGFAVEPYLFAGCARSRICNRLEIEVPAIDSSLNDAMVVAECFKKMMKLIKVKP